MSIYLPWQSSPFLIVGEYPTVKKKVVYQSYRQKDCADLYINKIIIIQWRVVINFLIMLNLKVVSNTLYKQQKSLMIIIIVAWVD